MHFFPPMHSTQSQNRHPPRITSLGRDPALARDPLLPRDLNASLRNISSILLHAARHAASEGPLHQENYHLTRVGTNESASSQFSRQSVYRISLDFSPLEIAQVQYTWNRMLVEEEEPQLSDNERPAVPGLMTRKTAVQALSTFCTQLYLNLLAMEPGLEKAFPLIRHQALSMGGVMSLAVASLDNLLSLDSYLEQLGKRHLRILGIEPPHFELMGEALIQSFVQRFGSKFTKELQVLWIKFYMYLANSIIQFGMDPVLRLDPWDPPLTAPLYLHPLELASVFSLELALILDSARRGSHSTGFTEVLLVREVHQAPGKPSLKSKKRLRLRKRGGDCVIV